MLPRLDGKQIDMFTLYRRCVTQDPKSTYCAFVFFMSWCNLTLCSG